MRTPAPRKKLNGRTLEVPSQASPEKENHGQRARVPVLYGFLKCTEPFLYRVRPASSLLKSTSSWTRMDLSRRLRLKVVRTALVIVKLV